MSTPQTFTHRKVRTNYVQHDKQYTVNSEDLFQPQNPKLAAEAPGVDQPTVGLFQPQLGQN